MSLTHDAATTPRHKKNKMFSKCVLLQKEISGFLIGTRCRRSLLYSLNSYLVQYHC